MKEIVKDSGRWMKESFNTLCEWIAKVLLIALLAILLFVTLYIALNTSCMPVEGEPTACVFTDSNQFIQKLSE